MGPASDAVVLRGAAPAPWFAPNPDPSCFFKSRGHKKALAYLEFGLAQGEGVVVITGAAGVGKTALVNQLRRRVDAGRVAIVALPRSGTDDVRARALIDEQVRGGRRVLLVADDAHELAPAALDALGRLVDGGRDGRPAAQLVLLGEPALTDVLALDELSALRARVVAAFELKPLQPEEADGYVRCRLSSGGWRGVPALDDELAAALHARAGGVPGAIDRLAARAFAAAAIAGAERVGLDQMIEVAVPVAAATAADERVASLERRVAEQEAVLRRVLSLFVDLLDEVRDVRPVRPRWSDQGEG